MAQQQNNAHIQQKHQKDHYSIQHWPISNTSFIKNNYNKQYQTHHSPSHQINEYNIQKVPQKLRNSYIELWNIEFLRINDNLKKVEKMEKLGVFKTFFLFLKLDIKKCPKTILKKKFAKMKIAFFLTFFWTFFCIFLTLNDQTTYDKNGDETIRKKVKKLGFFPDFSDFSGIFWDRLKKMDNFWITLHIFWIMVDNL